MEWKFNNDTPIYLQIIEQIKTMIVTGTLKPGDKIPPVREWAVQAGVNPNTMQKALAELEREGILYSARTSGRFVSDNNEHAAGLHEELVSQYIGEFTQNMRNIGYTPEQTLQMYNEYVKGLSKGE